MLIVDEGVTKTIVLIKIVDNFDCEYAGKHRNPKDEVMVIVSVLVTIKELNNQVY